MVQKVQKERLFVQDERIWTTIRIGIVEKVREALVVSRTILTKRFFYLRKCYLHT